MAVAPLSNTSRWRARQLNRGAPVLANMRRGHATVRNLWRRSGRQGTGSMVAPGRLNPQFSLLVQTALPPPEHRTSTTEHQSQTADISTPYRNALTGEVPHPRRTPLPHPVPPLPVIVLESKLQDCMQLSVQQFLALLDNHRCAIGPCKATNSKTRDIGVQCRIPDMAHKEVQTDPQITSPWLCLRQTSPGKSWSSRVTTQRRRTRRLQDNDPERTPLFRRQPRDTPLLAWLRRTLPLPGPQRRRLLRSERGSSRIRLFCAVSGSASGTHKPTISSKRPPDRPATPVLGPWPSSSRKSRRKEVALWRLRIGHCYSTISYLLRGEDRPSCSRCDVPLTVAHVLLACPRHRASRSRLLGRLEPTVTLRYLLGDDSVWVRSGTLFSFIREIQNQAVYSPGCVN